MEWGEGTAQPVGASGVLTRQFIRSEEFAVAYILAIIFVTWGLPTLGACIHFIDTGGVAVGCLFGSIGIGVTVICSWKFTTALKRAHHRYHPLNN